MNPKNTDIAARLDEYENFLSHLACQVSAEHKRHIEARLDELGITFPEFNIVGALLKHPGGLSQKQLADFLQLTPATMSVALEKLEKKEIVSRVSDEEDSRVKTVRVNVDAITKGTEIHNMLAQLEDISLQGLTTKDRKTVSDALKIMAKNLRNSALAILTALGLASPAFAATMELSQALLSARHSNPVLKASQQKEDIARGEAFQLLGPYDPHLVGSASSYEIDQPQSLGFPERSEGHDLSLGLKTSLPLGSEIFVGLAGGKKNTPGVVAGAPFAPRFNPEYSTGLNVNFRQSLLKDFLWLPGFATIKAGYARIDAAAFRAGREEEAILANVARAFAAWAAANEIATITRQTWEDARGFFDKTSRKHSQGLEELAELLQSESTLYARRAEYISAADFEKDAKENLWVAMGRQPADAEMDDSMPADIVHTAWKLAENLVELETQAREKRMDLKATVKDVEQTMAFYRRARSMALPDLAFSYDYRQAGLDRSMSQSVETRPDHASHTMALSLNVPLWPFLGSRGEILKARGNALQAGHMLKAAELELKREARASWRAWQTAEEAMDLADKRVNIEKRKMVQINRRYRDGQISGRELLLNQNDLLMARRAHAGARQALVNAKVQMLVTQGSFVENAIPPSTLERP